MAIVIINPKGVEPWIDALKQVDSSLDIRTFPNDTNREDITFALTWRHPYGIFKDYPNLKCISSMGAGVDHLLRDEELPHHVPITRLVDPYLAQDMAEFVLALVMNHLRDLNAFKLKQIQSIWKPASYQRIKDVTIGVMGVGAIGSKVAGELSRSGFKVIGWARSPKKDEKFSVYVGVREIADFLQQAQILVCVLPLTTQTKGILNKDVFKLLPKDAYVINVGRGEHLVDEDLLELISQGHLSGAALDVFTEEPLPATSSLWKHPRINVTPHIASLTDPQSVAPQIVENYHRAMEGRPLLNLVSRERGY
ncbi:MAG TPA: glyoxylate/hydroxypyruvate reductase A [Cyclobacteriaceae bacterium]|nr:glyoxylate/hydroxypyruvate reductase A [Cyclobacteriaceae bacterium]